MTDDTRQETNQGFFAQLVTKGGDLIDKGLEIYSGFEKRQFEEDKRELELEVIKAGIASGAINPNLQTSSNDNASADKLTQASMLGNVDTKTVLLGVGALIAGLAVAKVFKVI